MKGQIKLFLFHLSGFKLYLKIILENLHFQFQLKCSVAKGNLATEKVIFQNEGKKQWENHKIMYFFYPFHQIR